MTRVHVARIIRVRVSNLTRISLSCYLKVLFNDIYEYSNFFHVFVRISCNMQVVCMFFFNYFIFVSHVPRIFYCIVPI